MNRRTISLGRVLGIPVGLDPSWFLILALLTWTLAVSYYPAEGKGWPAAEYWVMGAVTAVMLFVSVLLHELGHSLTALRYKIPVRSITLFIFGGVSQIGAEPPSAASQFWISIAGPAVSFVLALFFLLLQPALAGVAPFLILAKYLSYINVALGAFNLIPGFPLDGGGVFRAAIWGITGNAHRATLIAANLGRAIAYLFIIVGVFMVLQGNFVNGLWIAFIGWFLENAAAGQVRQERLEAVLAGHTVSQAMARSYSPIGPDLTLQEIVDRQVLGSGQRSFIVERDEEILGLLTLHHIREISRDQWSSTTAAQAMLPLSRLKWIAPNAEIWAAMQEMDRDGVNQLPVMAEGKVIGLLRRDDVITYLRTLQEIGLAATVRPRET